MELMAGRVSTGGEGGAPAGRTNSVMLWAGTVSIKVLPVRPTSLRRLMELAEVSCHTWAVPAPKKLVRLRATIAVALNCLLMTITVSAPSEDRSAAKAETMSGFGSEVLTLLSPKADLLPS